jgi:RNA polymerase sigma-70 factor (ECF subfamily)
MTDDIADPLPSQRDARLSRITTLWTLVREAHADVAEGVPEAQQRLLEYYCGAAYRYLLGAVRNEQDAEELFQEFALRFLRGDFRRADPGKGRFRDYLKTALIHLISDHRSAQTRRGIPLPASMVAAEEREAEASDEAEFIASWREELLQRTWSALALSHPPLYHVLLRKAENPEITAAAIALDEARDRGTQPMSAATVRVMLHRARAKFGEILLQEVQSSLQGAPEDAVHEELRALGLWRYFR